MRIGKSDAEFVVRAAVAKTDEFNTTIGIAVDQIAIRRAVGCAHEDADAAVIVLADAIKLLFEGRIKPEIASMRCRHAAAGRIGKGKTEGGETLIRETAEVTPTAEFQFAIEARIAFLGVPDKLRLANDKGRIIDPE